MSKSTAAGDLYLYSGLVHDLIISRQKLQRARGIEAVRIKREQRTRDLCFS